MPAIFMIVMEHVLLVKLAIIPMKEIVSYLHKSKILKVETHLSPPSLLKE